MPSEKNSRGRKGERERGRKGDDSKMEDRRSSIARPSRNGGDTLSSILNQLPLPLSTFHPLCACRVYTQAKNALSAAALLDQLGDEGRPAGLVAGADAGAGVAVEEFVEEDIVAPVRVVLKIIDGAVERAAACLVP